MPSNLSSIGFTVHDMDAFANLAARAVEHGDRLDARYVRWAAGDGAELWVVLDRRDRICAMQPHFDGDAVIPVAVTEVLAEDDCDTTVYTWLSPQDGDPESGVHPAAVDVVGAGLLGGVTLPARARLQAALFAHELDVLEPGEELPYAVPSTIPTGLFARKPVAEVLVHAEVRDAEWRVNVATGRHFAWMRIDALAGELDVVADAELVGDLPAPGAVVRSSGWVSGRLHDVEEIGGRRRRFRRRLRLG